MSANPKYQKVIEFKTTFQLVLATNYLPTFSAHDSAFIDRLLILPFQTCFFKSEEQKKRAAAKGAKYFTPAKNAHVVEQAIKAERAQILLYLAKRYKELDTEIPESADCKKAKRLYVDDNNDIVKFLLETVEFDDRPANGMNFYFTPTRDLVDFYNEENNTRFSSKFVIMRTKEVFPLVEQASKVIDGKLTRGLKHIRIKRTAYPEGYQGNFSDSEKMEGEEF